jgi:hypothetical protein
MARLTIIKAAAAAEKAAQKAAQSNTKREPAPPGNIWISEDKLAELYPTVNKDGRTSLPGFGPPVNYMPDHDGGAERFGDTVRWVVNRCPNALQDWAPEPLTVRERKMMQIINALTDKPDWRRKVFDETILAKWRVEAVTEEGQGFTEKMFDYVSLHFLTSGLILFANVDSVLQSFKRRLVSISRMTWSLCSTLSGLWSSQRASSPKS